MKREELKGKVAKFAHGVDSHGKPLIPWRHEKGCIICNQLINFVEKILQDYNKAEGVFYPTEDEINSRK